MRRRLAIKVLAGTGLGLAAAAAALAAHLFWPAKPPPLPVSDGELLRYSVSFMGVEAGTLDLVASGEDASGPSLLVEMRITSTNKILERVFKIRETWRSRVDREGVFSRGYELTRAHGRKELADSQTHDYGTGVSRWTRLADGRERKGETPLAGPVQDPVSWLYYCRSRIARGEREIGFVLVERDHVRNASLVVAETEEIDLGAMGRVRAARASGSIGLGGLGGEEASEPGVDQATSVIWFDAATGVLVKATIAAKIGSVELVLREAENSPPVGGRP